MVSLILTSHLTMPKVTNNGSKLTMCNDILELSNSSDDNDTAGNAQSKPQCWVIVMHKGSPDIVAICWVVYREGKNPLVFQTTGHSFDMCPSL